MPSSRSRAIDLNADLGEGPGESPLYPLITSANIACGGHAGDDETMRLAVRLALQHGVALGAHPSYPDRRGFGRTVLTIELAELARSIGAQVAALARIAASEGARVTHVKPHGALYGAAAVRREVALAVADGVASVSSEPVLVGLAGSAALDVWRERGFRVAAEGFADRAYAIDGTLVPRTEPDALITDPAACVAQATRLAREGRCATLCVHGDTAGAPGIAAAVRRGLEEAGFELSALVGPPGES